MTGRLLAVMSVRRTLWKASLAVAAQSYTISAWSRRFTKHFFEYCFWLEERAFPKSPSAGAVCVYKAMKCVLKWTGKSEISESETTFTCYRSVFLQFYYLIIAFHLLLCLILNIKVIMYTYRKKNLTQWLRYSMGPWYPYGRPSLISGPLPSFWLHPGCCRHLRIGGRSRYTHMSVSQGENSKRKHIPRVWNTSE